MSSYFNFALNDILSNKKKVFVSVFSGILVYSFLNLNQIPVFYLPDLFILGSIFLFYKRINQKISLLVLIPILLLIGYLIFSPSKLDVEYTNKYFITIKPFFYLIIFYLFSNLQIGINFKKISLIVILFYPVMLIWSIFLFYITTGTFLKRPYFIFENNFEIPFVIACFICLTFVYKIVDIRVYFIVALSVLLTGSRSGLIAFALISIPFLFLLNKKSFLISILIACFTGGYLYYMRGMDSFNFNTIDRVQTFKGIFNYYDNSFINLLSHPFGVGIYKKIPPDICAPLRVWAEWFTGNFYNCDPILLQSYFTRSIYQLGIYVTFYIPLAFFLEANRVTTCKIAFLILIPVMSVALSAGGFSNGIAFISILFVVFSFNSKNNAFNSHYK